MTSRDIKFHLWAVLLVQSVTWSFIDSLPEKAHLPPWDDDYWYRRTTTDFPYWRRFTFSPTDYNFKPKSNGPEPFVWFILGGVLVLTLLILFIKYVCEHTNDSDTYDSTAQLHPPPAVVLRPPDVVYQPATTSPPWQPPINPSGVPPGRSTYNFQAGVPTTYGPRDGPPGYSEVVMSDFVDEMKKFPEVRLPDTPPPKYEGGNLPKY